MKQNNQIDIDGLMYLDYPYSTYTPHSVISWLETQHDIYIWVVPNYMNHLKETVEWTWNAQWLEKEENNQSGVIHKVNGREEATITAINYVISKLLKTCLFVIPTNSDVKPRLYDYPDCPEFWTSSDIW